MGVAEEKVQGMSDLGVLHLKWDLYVTPLPRLREGKQQKEQMKRCKSQGNR